MLKKLKSFMVTCALSAVALGWFQTFFTLATYLPALCNLHQYANIFCRLKFPLRNFRWDPRSSVRIWPGST